MRALTNDCDERLLVEAAQRDPSRFAELYELNFERVYAFIVKRVRDRDTAQDVTSEVFHEALANIRSFEWRGVPFAAWLYRIAANCIADRWKRQGRELPAEAAEEPLEDPQFEQRALLVQLVQQLPADQRLVITRRFFEDRSIREIADEMGRSDGAIKQLQLRALGALKNLAGGKR